MSDAHFSTSVLNGFLQYIKKHQSAESYGKLIDTLRSNKIPIEIPAWLTAEDMGKFFRIINDCYPNLTNIPFEATLALYTQKKFQIFTSFAGLLLRPDIAFGKLSSSAKRMNTYNSYEFILDHRKITYSSGRLIQRYLDPKLTDLNRNLCQASRGSVTGLVKFLGYRLIELNEIKCVSKGNEYCEYQIAWVNRTMLKRILAFILLTPALAWIECLVSNQSPMLCLLHASLGSLLLFGTLAYYRIRSNLREAFEYQSEALDELRHTSQVVRDLNVTLMDYQQVMNETLSLAHMGELSYGLIHDMATPMTLLSFYAREISMILGGKTSSNDEVIKYSKGIERATAGLLKLQNLFRTFARKTGNDAPISLDLAECIRSCTELYTPFLENSDIALQVNVPSGPVFAEVIEGTIERILLNLIQNAIKVLAKHETRVLTLELSESESSATLVVMDSGPGLPKERLESLWAKFGHSGSNSSKRKHEEPKGTGFGLYEVKQFVDRLSGRIEVLSSSDGTQFKIVIPKRFAKSSPKAA